MIGLLLHFMDTGKCWLKIENAQDYYLKFIIYLNYMIC